MIAASPDAVYRALWTTDFARSPVVRILLGLRGLPARIRAGASRSRPRELTLHAIVAAGFGVLVDEPNQVVLGVSGRFWRPAGNLEPFDRDGFSRPVPPGLARAVWSFDVAPHGEHRTTLSTETRVTCGDRASRIRFRAYWLVVRPFSGWIRIVMLRAVRRTAEA